MRKTFIEMFMVLVMTLIVTACGGGGTTPDTNTNGSASNDTNTEDNQTNNGTSNTNGTDINDETSTNNGTSTDTGGTNTNGEETPTNNETTTNTPLTALLPIVNGTAGSIIPLGNNAVKENVLPVVEALVDTVQGVIGSGTAKVFTVVNGAVVPLTDIVGATDILLSVEGMITTLLHLEEGVVTEVIEIAGEGLTADDGILLGLNSTVTGLLVSTGGIITEIIPVTANSLNLGLLDGFIALLPFDLSSISTLPLGAQGLLLLDAGTISGLLVVVDGIVQDILPLEGNQFSSDKGFISAEGLTAITTLLSPVLGGDALGLNLVDVRNITTLISPDALLGLVGDNALLSSLLGNTRLSDGSSLLETLLGDGGLLGGLVDGLLGDGGLLGGLL